MSSRFSYQASAYPTSYSQNGSLYQPGLSNGRQNTISASENTIMNIPILASVFNSTSSALEKAHKSLFSSPLNILGGLVERMETTLHGSAHDIGWLQRTYPTNPVQDGTNRFMELLAVISEASVKSNAQELTKQIENLYLYHGKKVLVLGHSKGGVDAAAAMAMHWSNLKDKVAGLALVQSPYGGTPIASDILGEGQIAESVKRIILELLMCNFIQGDMSALEDLTYSKRKQFLSQYALPVGLPVISFHTEASTGAQALATLSHIRHFEFPSFAAPSSSFTSNQTVKVPIMAPLATAMAACASYLYLKYGEKSDGLVTRKDAEVPGSLVVKPNRKLDHAWMSLPSSTFDVSEPNASQMYAALLALLVEIGQGKNRWQKIALAK